MKDRRKALKVLGTLVACLAGYVKTSKAAPPPYLITGVSIPSNSYHFNADTIMSIVIERKGKKDLVVPFSEIVEALEGE